MLKLVHEEYGYRGDEPDSNTLPLMRHIAISKMLYKMDILRLSPDGCKVGPAGGVKRLGERGVLSKDEGIRVCSGSV